MNKELFVRLRLKDLKREEKFFLNNKIYPEVFISGNEIIKGKKELLEILKPIENFKKNTIHAPFLDITMGGFDDELRDKSLEKLLKIVEIGNEINSELIVMHVNYEPTYYEEYFETWIKRTTQFLKTLLNNTNSLIAIENIGEPTPYIFLRIKEKINNKKLIFCFDFGHHNVYSIIDFEEWIFYLKKFTNQIHFHLHDNNGDFDQHLPIGEGNINWTKAFEFLNSLNLKLSFTLEPHNKKDLIKSLKNYKKLISEYL